ncbi:MAG: glycosyltransferase [Candidatus Omnitrophica bacterium]|nr:glycosyltransferase [Candidatus Omnitrophota bacterium]
MKFRVLLMYISPRSGHHAAALAIDKALHQIDPTITTSLINSFRYTNPILERVVSETYLKVIQTTPEVWDFLYDNPALVKNTQTFRKLIHRFNSKKLSKLIKEFKPDAIICTQAFPCGMVADYKKREKMDLPIIAVLTDYCPHSYWMYDNVDAYIVGSFIAVDRFKKSGIPAERIYEFGIPIDPNFTRVPSNETIRTRWGLDPKLPVVLVMGGSQGLGPIKDVVQELAQLSDPFQLAVVCGSNSPLKRWLERHQEEINKKVVIYGYLKEVNELMAASLVLVTKPGGLTSAEAVAMRLPMILINPIPGQEALNARILLNKRISMQAVDGREVALLTQRLLCGPQLVRDMREAAQQLARPHSAIETAALALRLARR